MPKTGKTGLKIGGPGYFAITNNIECWTGARAGKRERLVERSIRNDSENPEV